MGQSGRRQGRQGRQGGGQGAGADDDAEAALDKETDTLLVQELEKMSLQEREQVLYEIHGVDDKMKETTELVQKSLRELNQMLDEESSKINAANHAVASHPTPDESTENPLQYVLRYQTTKTRYVRSGPFLLMFLRSERYDPTLAFTRLKLFLRFKASLFGLESLQREHVTFDDMIKDGEDSDTMKTLLCGYTQVLKQRDRAGRAIWFSLTHLRFDKPFDSICKTWFYLIMGEIQNNVETQLNGIIVVRFDYGERPDNSNNNVGPGGPSGGPAVAKTSSIDHYKKFQELITALPFRLISIHICNIKPLSVIQKVISEGVASVGKQARTRIRFHNGRSLFPISKGSMPCRMLC